MKYFDDLPEIAFKPHAQAKRLKLVVSQKGIRLTYPPKTRKTVIDIFLKQSYAWLLQTWQKQQILDDQQAVKQQLPNVIQLAYTSQPYQIIYRQQTKKYILDLESKILYISLKAPEYFLTRFVIDQSKTILMQQLFNFAQQKKCCVQGVRIATPKTRWGSCSSKQDIMLHAGLLIMPQEYANYVLLHELAHTKVMNHQPEFWVVLNSFLPDAKKIQSEVKKFRLPFWWQPKLKFES